MKCDRLGPEMARYRELPEQAQRELDRHAAACPTCAARLAAYAAQDRALAALPTVQPTAAWVTRVRTAARPRQAARGRLALPQRALGLAAALMLLLITSLTASANALPGDALYSLKRAQEELRLRLSVGPAQATYGEVLQAQRRDEAWQLIQLRRSAVVRFEGEVEAADGDVWLISGLPVRLQGEGPLVLAVGDRLQVQGRTAAGVVEAQQVQVLARAPQPAAPTTAAPTTAMPTTQPAQIRSQQGRTATLTVATATPPLVATPRAEHRPTETPPRTRVVSNTPDGGGATPRGTPSRAATGRPATATIAPAPSSPTVSPTDASGGQAPGSGSGQGQGGTQEPAPGPGPGPDPDSGPGEPPDAGSGDGPKKGK